MYIIAHFVGNSLTVRILKTFPDFLTIIYFPLIFSVFVTRASNVSHFLISDHVSSAIPPCIITNLHPSNGSFMFLVPEVIAQYLLTSADFNLDASGKKEHAILLFLCLSCLIKTTHASKK